MEKDIAVDDHGVATKGSETTLEDLTKSWEENICAGATLSILIENTLYIKKVTSNTNQKLTFKALPDGVKARKGDRWILRRSELAPLEKASEHNLSVTADTNILSQSLTPLNTPCLFRIMVCLGTAGVFSAMVTKADSTQQLKFNSASNLTADAVYIFDILVNSGDTVNFQHSATATLKVLRVQEIVGAVQ
ncbi:hypothetical protein ES708_33405 [subsurface metagenome]